LGAATGSGEGLGDGDGEPAAVRMAGTIFSASWSLRHCEKNSPICTQA